MPELSPPTSSRRLAEGLILFLIAILFLRALIVEPYGVPTGSMAVTFLGNHTQLACPRCGQHLQVGDSAGELRSFCWNCGNRDFSNTAITEVQGDRLMVNKILYTQRKPKRWEVAVFRCPSDPLKPYVKRVIGMPNEAVFIEDGDILIDGELSRKTPAEARACMIPVWDFDHAPKPDGWRDRLALDGAAKLEAGRIAFDGDTSCEYRNWSFESRKEEPLSDQLTYNNPGSGGGAANIHDLLLEWSLRVDKPGGVFALELTDGADGIGLFLHLQADVTRVELVQRNRLLRSCLRPAIKPGECVRLSLAFVDRRASATWNGTELFTPFDFPRVVDRPGIERPFRISTQGFHGEATRLALFRDVHYRSSGDHGVRKPYELGAREYFMLGDNSINSDDSRSWGIPAVPEANFQGKPFLLHQPGRKGTFSVGTSHYSYPTVDWSRIKWIH